MRFFISFIIWDFSIFLISEYGESYGILFKPWESILRKKVNVSKYSKMKPQTRKILIDFFKPYNEQLFKFLDKKFDWNI